MTLRSITKLPPQGWILEQRDAEGKVIHTFASMIPFNDAVKEIVAFRRANNLPNAEPIKVTQELHTATCLRLNNHPEYCVDRDYVPPANEKPRGGCGSCGAQNYSTS